MKYLSHNQSLGIVFMSEFVWLDKYSLGNAQIDAEHQRLMSAWVLEHILTDNSRIAPPKTPEEPADSPKGLDSQS